MKLTDDDVARFRRIYKESYGEELPSEEARVLALRLIRLYQLLVRPTPSERATRLAKSSEGATLKESSASAPAEGLESPSTLP